MTDTIAKELIPGMDELIKHITAQEKEIKALKEKARGVDHRLKNYRVGFQNKELKMNLDILKNYREVMNKIDAIVPELMETDGGTIEGLVDYIKSQKDLKKENEKLKKENEDLKSPETHSKMMDDYLENYLDDKGFQNKDLDQILKEYDGFVEELFTMTHGVQLETGKTIKENLEENKELTKENKKLKEKMDSIYALDIMWYQEREKDIAEIIGLATECFDSDEVLRTIKEMKVKLGARWSETEVELQCYREMENDIAEIIGLDTECFDSDEVVSTIKEMKEGSPLYMYDVVGEGKTMYLGDSLKEAQKHSQGTGFLIRRYYVEDGEPNYDEWVTYGDLRDTWVWQGEGTYVGRRECVS